MAVDPEERRRRLLLDDDGLESIKKAVPVPPVPGSETTGRRHSKKAILKQDTVSGKEPAPAASSAADAPSI
eukprot:4315032-Heterocapsa_arctica.AAC.1